VYTGGRKSLVLASIDALDAYWQKLISFYGGSAKWIVACLEGEDALDCLKGSIVGTLDEWTRAVIDALPQE
jgi:hypothetical protein